MSEVEIIMIEDEAALAIMAAAFEKQKVRHLALDFEAEANQFRYGVHLCLVQIFDGSACYIIDPLKINDLAILKRLLQSHNIEKVFFSADFDVRLIKHTLGIAMVNLFDLQVAAKILEFEKTSLEYLGKFVLEREIATDKTLQRSNWNLRPLSERQIEYAAGDVLHLLDLAIEIKRMLAQKSVMRQCHEKNLALASLEMKEPGLSNTILRRTQHFTTRQNDYLKKLYDIREQVASEIDVPPYRVFSNDLLIQLCKEPPETVEQWSRLKALPRRTLKYIDRFII